MRLDLFFLRKAAHTRPGRELKEDMPDEYQAQGNSEYSDER
jgi:hypothetical protein